MTTTSAATPPRAGPATELTVRRLGRVRRFFARRPRAMDGVVMAVFAFPAVLGTLVVVAAPLVARVPPRLGDLGLGLVLTTLGTLALNWRRRAPVVVTACMSAVDVLAMSLVGTTLELGVAFGMYAVAASRPPRTTWVTFGLTSTLGVAVGVSTSSDTGIFLTSLIALAIGTSVRHRRLHVSEIVERTNALARDRDQQAQLARTAERTRIAREMHDVVAHNLAVMIALADGAGAALATQPDRTRHVLGEVSETGRSALADMRRVLGVLHEPDAQFEPQPGSTDLPTLVERFRTAGLDVRTTGLGLDLPDDAGLQLTVYRIVSEALTNALRHAPGTGRVEIALTRTAEAVEVDVRDEGPAALPVRPPSTGHGLIGMAERAAVYGGTVEAGPTPTGWRVHAVLPWTEGDA